MENDNQLIEKVCLLWVLNHEGLKEQNKKKGRKRKKNNHIHSPATLLGTTPQLLVNANI